MNIRKSEIFRYLGYKNHEYDKETDLLIDDIIQKFLDVVTPKSIYKEYSLSFSDNTITIGGQNGMVISSSGLTKNLTGCTGVILFSATLGSEADALIRRYQVVSIARAAVAQAVCTELIEAYCNETNDILRAKKLKDGYRLRPRFSAGYGDFKLSHQRDFFRMLDITKKLGVCLNDECLMSPTKSVTAVIGFGSNLDNNAIEHCNSCNKKDCEFRNEF